LDRCAGHISGLEEAYAAWARLAREEAGLNAEIEAAREKMAIFESGWSTENYLSRLQELHELEQRLERAASRRGLVREGAMALGQTLSSPALATVQDSPVDYQLPGLRAEAARRRQQAVVFRDHWKDYEEQQTTLQPWLGVAEEQLEAGGSGMALLHAELETYSRLREEANTSFSEAMETLPGLDDEELQRQLHLQFEERWERFARRMAEEKEPDDQNESLITILKQTEELLESVEEQATAPFSHVQGAEELLAILHKLTYLKKLLVKRQKELSQQESTVEEAMERVGMARRKLAIMLLMVEKKIEDGQNAMEQCQRIRRNTSTIQMDVEHLKTYLTRVTSDLVSGEEPSTVKIAVLEVRLLNDENMHMYHEMLFQDCRAQITKCNSDVASAEEDIKALKEGIAVGDLNKQLNAVKDAIIKTETKASEEIQLAEQERTLWSQLEAKQLEVRSRIAETGFQLELSLARGHIDMERLRACLATVQGLEASHLAGEGGLVELRAATDAVQAVASRQDGAEMAGQLESTIVSYNTVCRSLLGE
jgi:hypothetical protein